MQDITSEFSKRVLRLIKSVPKGNVATYGLIAKLAGNPRGSRGVGWLLHSCTIKYNLPWQRIIKSNGRLSFPETSRKFHLQKNKLAAEGITVANGRVNLKKFLWKKQPEIFLNEFADNDFNEPDT